MEIIDFLDGLTQESSLSQETTPLHRQPSDGEAEEESRRTRAVSLPVDGSEPSSAFTTDYEVDTNFPVFESLPAHSIISPKSESLKIGMISRTGESAQAGMSVTAPGAAKP
jgi:hypothetical protein